MTDRKLAAVALALGLAAGTAAAQAAPQVATQTTAPETKALVKVVASPGTSPLVAVRLMFAAGSIHDPRGKEGLASLTASMLGSAATQKHGYADLLEALYPMAATIDVNTDREVTELSGLVHRDKLAEYTELLKEVILQPAFSEQDFQRNKDQLSSYLANTLQNNDEMLGLEALQTQLFKNHPYGHPTAGTEAGLKSITLDDVKRFYGEHYTASNLMLGVAGGYPKDYPETLQRDLAALPMGTAAKSALPALPKTQGRNFVLLNKSTASVGINFGYTLPITRADADYFPLMVANSFLGEHRTFHGRLMQQLRGARGLNYGDYSYIEYYPAPPFTNSPTPGSPRHQQYFSIWIRPVVPADAHFALRAGLYEVQRLRDKGMTQEEFDLTRAFLLNYTKLWAQSVGDRLGFQMDSAFYGTPYFIDEVDSRLKSMKLADVNAAIRKYFTTDNYTAVIVTDNAAQLKDALQKDAPSTKTYGSPVPPDTAEADKIVLPLAVKPTSVEIVPAADLYKK